MAFSGSQRTRLGLYGGSRSPYGSFAGKTEFIQENVPFDADTLDGSGSTLTVTAFVNGAGHEMRAPRLEHFHAADSARDADLTGYDRLELDRYHALSDRTGRGQTLAYDTHRLRWVAKRAGERFSPREIILDVEIDESESRLDAVTADRTNAAGHEMRYPAWRAWLASDSGRDVALDTVGASDRDRNRVKFAVPSDDAVGWVHRLRLQADGRAGNRFCVKEIIVEYDLVYDANPKAAAT